MSTLGLLLLLIGQGQGKAARPARQAPAAAAVYVSSARGNDANPGTRERPLRTVAAATARLGVRQNASAGTLNLERGGQYEGPLPLYSGLDARRPYTVAAFGEGPRPLLLCRGEWAARAPVEGWRHARVSGIDFYADGDDPASPRNAPVGPKLGGVWRRGAAVANVEFSDCRSRFVQWTFENRTKGPADLALRRCVILDTYPIGKAHCQGLFAYDMAMTLEDCVFDHNGWSEAAPTGKATMFNHNVYLSHARDTTVKGCTFLRASSIGLKVRSDETGAGKNIVIDDNLFVEGEIGITIGGNTEAPGRFVAPRVTDNVFLHIGRTRPTGRALGWGVEAVDWDGGTIAGNVMLHQPDSVRRGFFVSLDGAARGVLVRGNLCEGMRGPLGALKLKGGSGQTGSVEGNAFASADAAVVSEADPSGFTFNDNRWAGGRIVAGRRVGESAPAPPRAANVDLPLAFEELIRRVREQGQRGPWDESLAAATINGRIRGALGVTAFDR